MKVAGEIAPRSVERLEAVRLRPYLLGYKSCKS